MPAPPPTAFTTMSIRPNRSDAAATIRSASASTVASAMTAMPSEPAARTRSTVASSDPWLRPATATFAPAPAKASAIADPMAPPPPEMRATRPSRLKMSS